ncbi:hypothetical protein BDW74DRAFT_158437 [Aspergillus multicolor]|uniref:uncharacterized protein n=1 Tax=Aspergillus multicolor TaxID=41759 RepID=UPI003CCE51F8
MVCWGGAPCSPRRGRFALMAWLSSWKHGSYAQRTRPTSSSRFRARLTLFFDPNVVQTQLVSPCHSLSAFLRYRINLATLARSPSYP